jgi:UDP-N-acetylmuramoyl-tripeptide--D-alanyl-D-alanine ligase
MITIGYMHGRKNPETMAKAYAFAAAARAEGARLLYFTPGAVDTKRKKIKGFIYRKGKWETGRFNYPHVIYNAAGFDTKKQNETVDSLMDEVPFTSFSVGSKTTVFNNLKRYGEFNDYLIPTVIVASAEQALALIQENEAIILKPSSGCRGEGVYFIGKAHDAYKIIPDAKLAYHSPLETADFIAKKLAMQEYIAQPYINSRTQYNQPFDLRLHVQKGGQGQWNVSTIYPRISLSENIVCNISGGGCTMDVRGFMKNEYGGEGSALIDELNEFALRLAAHMDTIQWEMYGERLDELGIDIGLDKSRRIRIYEINWRPGYPPSISGDLTVARNCIRYAMYLANSRDNAP